MMLNEGLSDHPECKIASLNGAFKNASKPNEGFDLHTAGGEARCGARACLIGAAA